MSRHLDLAALRSFVAVAESGGVTRASGFLHLTQSAVSMQIKRLEEALQVRLFDRTGRGVTTTAEGEQLLGYARRLLALNDETLHRMTAAEWEGEIALGVPHDIVLPVVPDVLRSFSRLYPRMRINLVSSYTTVLRRMHERGDCDVILTTEHEIGAGGEALSRRRLLWIGSPDGRAWRERPLPLAFERTCIFRPLATRALEEAGIPWTVVTDTDNSRTVGAMVLADLAVHAVLDGVSLARLQPVPDGALPMLPEWTIGLYGPATERSQPVDALLDLLREGYRAPAKAAAPAIAAE